ncbi:PhnA-like protein [Lichenihabitans sp. Uapishka_5]|uniref:PhnA-like protein n=1 Tax=Lichenihabitans sp. Uapishka_5 TaxID=3037302 RepID=UPI0029E81E2E|nr:PhnA-like protein [Lichenihabitans sp. Uapishka_5]MDX7950533.1 PhnA-like protein [Lichenihabitans sp. Uapishka_5]
MTSITGIATEPSAHDRAVVGVAPGHSVSWGAIFAGVVMALVVQLILSILGLGIGLATVDPASTGTPSASGLSFGAAIWWVLSGIVAAALGGFVAGRLSGKPVTSTAGYHGLVSWGVTTMVIVFLLSSAVGGIVGGAFSAVTSTLGGAGHALGGAVQTVAQAAAPSLPGMNDPLSGIESQIRSASGGQDPAQLRDAATQAIKAAVTGDPSQQQQALDRAANALAKAENISVDQAKSQVQTYQQQYAQAVAQAKVKATEVADAAAKTTSQASLMIVLSLVLGAIASVIGGRFGTVRLPRRV